MKSKITNKKNMDQRIKIINVYNIYYMMPKKKK